VLCISQQSHCWLCLFFQVLNHLSDLSFIMFLGIMVLVNHMYLIALQLLGCE